MMTSKGPRQGPRDEEEAKKIKREKGEQGQGPRDEEEAKKIKREKGEQDRKNVMSTIIVSEGNVVLCWPNALPGVAKTVVCETIQMR